MTIGISEGIGGHYAVLYDSDGPIQTGLGRYPTPLEAAQEAQGWAEAERLPLERRVRDMLMLPDNGRSG